MKHDFMFLHDIDFGHELNDRHIFIDNSSKSLRCVLHNGNWYPSIPIEYSKLIQETFKYVTFLLETIDYNRCKSQVWQFQNE